MSQAKQDLFVLYCFKNKRSGTFLEIGSNDPIKINNTYLLESKFDWSGIMIEMDKMFVESYKTHRPNSKYIIADASKLDYIEILKDYKDIDYLQIDLEVNNGSTINCLLTLEKAMASHKFGVVTFEHDIWRGDYYNTRGLSREIFKNQGYELIFPDISDQGCVYEDWYIHPDLVDISVKSEISLDFNEAIKLLI